MYKDIEDDTSNNWSVFQLGADEDSTIVRLKVIEPILTLTQKIRIVWEYSECENGSFPSDEELGVMADFENGLDLQFEESTNSIFVFSVVGDGLRQWVFYAENVETFMNNLNKCLEVLPQLPIELEAEEDKDWSEFKEVLALVTQSQ